MIQVYGADLSSWKPEHGRGRRRRRSSLAGGLLLAYALAAQGRDVKLISGLRREEGGKPYLEGAEDFHFNLSHSGPYVVCAVGNAPVGVDVQIMRPKGERIAERFFCPYEAEQVKSSPHPTRTFTELWAAKEAYVKMLGTGLRRPLDSFGVREGWIEDFLLPENSCRLTLFDQLTGAALAVCGREEADLHPVFGRAEDMLSGFEEWSCGM